MKLFFFNMLNLKKYCLTTELFDIRFFKAESLKLVNFLKTSISIFGFIYMMSKREGKSKKEKENVK